MNASVITKIRLNIPVAGSGIKAELIMPNHPKGLIIFAQPGNSLSSEEDTLAEHLAEKQFAVVMAELLSEEEDLVFENRYNIRLQVKRLTGLTHWIRDIHPGLKQLPTGYFGFGTGTAVAITAAADPELQIRCIVSAGGRPDLAGEAISGINTPVLLITGGLNSALIELNQKAMTKLRAKAEMHILPGIRHIFEEPCDAEKLAGAAQKWFSGNFKNTRKAVFG